MGGTRSLAAAALVAAALLARSAAAFDYVWHTGRATHYGGPGDPWSIHNGHCGYGYLDPSVGTGWDICAPSDQNWDFDSSTSSCGVCYEVSCQGMNFNDFYGNYLDRGSVCREEGASVVVMVTDLCPCYYPANSYSNKRWCCGDMQHFDISVWAFEKLADVKWGVIGIKYRRVPCDHQPARRAWLPSGQSPSSDSTSRPWGWDSSKDKRWGLGSHTQSGNTDTSASTSASASASSSASASASSASGQPASSVVVSYSASGSQGGQQSSVTNAYYGGFMQGWSDAGSWGISKWGRDSSWGLDGQQAYCVTLSGSGGVKFNAWSGAFASKRTIEFLARQNNGQAPDISVVLAAPAGGCRPVDVRSLGAAEQRSGWSRFQVQLTAADWRRSSADGSAFGGCSGSVSDWDVNTVMFTNKWGGDQYLCLDQVKVY